jgi:SAM-dependent methyltransferase
MATSPARDAIVTRSLGLPPELQSTSMLAWSGIAEVTEALGLGPGDRLLDLACGRGGYGIEVAWRTGARLTGVDFAEVALAAARASSARRLPPGQSEFVAGTLIATGRPAASADAVMCVDAVQFAEPPLDALHEIRRVLVPGGRLALTSWEATYPDDARVSARIRAMDLARDLPAAGFTSVRVADRPDWRELEREMWQEAMAAPAGDDPAMRSLQAEGRRSLDAFDSLRRVYATAIAPA